MDNQPPMNNRANGYSAIVAATATAVPPHTLSRDDVKAYVGKVFDLEERRLDALMTVVDNAQVGKRHSIFAVDDIIKPRSLEQKSGHYKEHAVRLGREAAEGC